MAGLSERIRGALGLRGRIVGVVLVTVVATLAVASILLLGPLENSLRKAELQTLEKQVNHKTTKAFRELPLGQVLRLKSTHPDTVLRDAEARLNRRVGGPVTLLVAPVKPGERPTALLAGTGADAEDAGTDDSYGDALQAFRTDHAVYSHAVIDGTEYARAAIPFSKVTTATGVRIRYVLAVRKSIAEIPGVVHVVRRAFLDAALAGLLLTLVLGIPLSGRLVRRLRRLREAAFAVEHDSPEAVLPVDTARDEVGGLARTLASMQQRLRRQEEARRSFVATASHELRTPLTSLDGMLELLHEDLQDDDLDLADARELLDRARAQSRRLGRLAADLLDLSRIDAQVQLRSEPVELAELSRAVLAEFELGNVERSIHSSLSDAQDATWALGDPGSIARILRILLDNAQRASPPASEIRVLVRHGDHASITVCDEGPGVPQEERDAIFQRFNRGRETAGQGGFGLGLAIGRELARRMGGDLVLEAQTPPGARFTLRLPVARGGRDPVPEPLGVV
jgi:signal transduction histidine kinase